MLMRFDPFREIDRVAQLLGQQPTSRRSVPMPMPMDAYRKDGELIVHFDLPGVESSSIDLTVEKNGITVEAERRWELQDDEDLVVVERPQGKFTRQIYLGDNLDIENIEASYDNGVLTLTIPIGDDAKPRKIEVTAGPQSSGRETVDVGSA